MNDEIKLVLKEIRLRRYATWLLLVLNVGLCLSLVYGLPLEKWLLGSVGLLIVCFVKALRTELKLLALAQRANLMHRV